MAFLFGNELQRPPMPGPMPVGTPPLAQPFPQGGSQTFTGLPPLPAGNAPNAGPQPTPQMRRKEGQGHVPSWGGLPPMRMK